MEEEEENREKGWEREKVDDWREGGEREREGEIWEREGGERRMMGERSEKREG